MSGMAHAYTLNPGFKPGLSSANDLLQAQRTTLARCFLFFLNVLLGRVFAGLLSLHLLFFTNMGDLGNGCEIPSLENIIIWYCNIP
jgi:hypothetical protein